MASSRFKRPEPCAHENCGSRRFHVGDDGFTYCDRGHQQSERGALVADDTGEYGLAGRKSRRKDSDVESTTSRASGFSGPRAFEHYLLCVQLVLRIQLRWLIEAKKLPEDLEVLVRDLWALRLQKLQNRVTYDSETETETQSQYFSSQSEGETSASQSSRRSQARSKTRIAGTPTLTDTLVLCYIGALLLREPVTVAQLHSWASDGQILYYGASKKVPLSMRERLTPTYQDLLEPSALGEPEGFHRRVYEVLSSFATEFGMAVRPLNHPLLIHCWMKELALPIEVFAATSRLARVLDVDFAFKLDGKVGTKDVVLRYPEIRLMALLVVATKILFPFDSTRRHPASASDMSALGVDWTVWAELQELNPGPREDERLVGQKLGYREAMEYSQSDVLGAAEDRLDQYMDWIERNIATEDIRERGRAGQEAEFRRHLFRMFPAHGVDAVVGDDTNTQEQISSQGEVTKRLRQVQGTLRPKRTVEPAGYGEEDVGRTGTAYRRYRTAEDLSGPVKMFYARSAGLAGSSLDGMVRAVFLIERKMQTYEEKARR